MIHSDDNSAANSAPHVSSLHDNVSASYARSDQHIRADLARDIQERDERRAFDAHHLWNSLSFKAQLALAFSLIAAITALVTISVVSIMWGQYFRDYTTENMQSLANAIAEQIGNSYNEQGTLDAQALQPARSAAAITKGVGIQVRGNDGLVLYDSTTGGAATLGYTAPSTAPVEDTENTTKAAIVSRGEQIGTVRVWVYGSNQLLREGDQEFRDKSYQAMVIASIVAIVLASVLGYLYARRVEQPIKRITDVALAARAGDLTVRANLEGNNEIARLGQTFDSMMSAIERDRKLERRLTTDVAHELRTPLMAIQSTVEAMVDGVLPIDEEHLATVDNEVMRLSRLVGSLLKLSRLENRSNPIKKEVVDVGSVVRDIVATHETYVHDAGLTLNFTAEPNVYVMGDPDMLRQATANLIANAVRYTDEGGSIEVTVRRDHDMASIVVRDTGIGLSQTEARMVFERFWRADPSRDREKGGLGVGLTVVKEIVERHNGWVQVEGIKGEGACFTIHIPLMNEGTNSNKGSRMGRSNRSQRLKLPQINMK